MNIELVDINARMRAATVKIGELELFFCRGVCLGLRSPRMWVRSEYTGKNAEKAKSVIDTLEGTPVDAVILPVEVFDALVKIELAHACEGE